MISRNPLKVTVLVACAILSVAGALGMVLSFLYMASADPRDITAGTSGFIAGAGFVCASLVLPPSSPFSLNASKANRRRRTRHNDEGVNKRPNFDTELTDRQNGFVRCVKERSDTGVMARHLRDSDEALRLLWESGRSGYEFSSALINMRAIVVARIHRFADSSFEKTDRMSLRTWR